MKSLMISVRNFFIEDTCDTTAREIYIKMEQIEKKAEDAKANASNNNEEIESLKFEMKEQSGKISKQFVSKKSVISKQSVS